MEITKEESDALVAKLDALEAENRALKLEAELSKQNYEQLLDMYNEVVEKFRAYTTVSEKDPIYNLQFKNGKPVTHQ